MPGPFDIAGKPPARVVVTAGDELPSRPEPRSMMLDLSIGVLGELTPKEITALRVCGQGVGAKVMDEPVGDWPLVCVVHCVGEVGERRVEVRRLRDGGFAAVDPMDVGGKPVRLVREKFEALGAAWPAYRGDFTPPAGLLPGVAGEMPRPYVQGWYTNDPPTLGTRFLNGRKTNIAGTVRDLKDETLWARLPARHDPREPVGLIVWIDARQRAGPQDSLFRAADELGFMIIGATVTGNDRPTADRFQLALDGVATASRAVLVDPARVYAAGLSGGGKISTHLWACYPDVIRGAVPVVALASYRDVPAGPGKIWPGDFQLPRDAPRLGLVRAHRCGVMTGPPDFNYEPIRRTVEVMKGDRLPVRVFDYADMAHEMPRPERFLEVLSWVDEPARSAREKSVAEATRLLAAAEASGPARTPAQRAALVEITSIAPFSAPARRAAELLEIPGAR
jgi:hypothetical protein